ncbi:hypothetical protein [Syntrophomonas wolfei]|jgi:hypothetical protein|uniref:hypothetical protein n=1 Tax=Syntrophomonas wolfei TaxID=863 RepID=UPI000A9D7795|nr:hypothetical protein [Syntrophomonas wolfei]
MKAATVDLDFALLVTFSSFESISQRLRIWLNLSGRIVSIALKRDYPEMRYFETVPAV